VYYTNSGGPAIGVVSYDGSSARTLIRAHLTKPRAIVLLPHQNYRYNPVHIKNIVFFKAAMNFICSFSKPNEKSCGVTCQVDVFH
jgi:hypothetical protein